jgi:hemolysin III
MNRKQYTPDEEIVNAAIHGMGILLGMAAGIWLLFKALFYGDLWAVSSVATYVVCMLFSYTASTLYHACREEKRKITLRKLDHAAIYFHIAGTYTFFTLTILRNAALWGWSLFFVVWIATVVGSYISFKGKGIGKRMETICYVVMGLVVFVAFKPLYDTLNSAKALDVLLYIIAGGVSFILGAFLYSFKKIPYVHAMFHLFVIGGSFFHVWAIAVALECNLSLF